MMFSYDNGNSENRVPGTADKSHLLRGKTTITRQGKRGPIVVVAVRRRKKEEPGLQTEVQRWGPLMCRRLRPDSPRRRAHCQRLARFITIFCCQTILICQTITGI